MCDERLSFYNAILWCSFGFGMDNEALLSDFLGVDLESEALVGFNGL